MMRFLRATWSFVIFGLVVAVAAGLFYQLFEVPVMVTAGVALLMMLARAYVRMKDFDSTAARSAVEVEIWAAYIMGAIFKNNEFLNYAFNADSNVLAGKVVHIPQAGGTASVTKNRSSLPATVNKRTDTDITYPLDEFTTDPRLIPNADTVELSYDKMASVMTDDMNALRQTVADNLLINWAPATNILRTTGGAILSYTPSATGNRAALQVADFQAAQKFFNKQDMPTDGRYVLLSADMHDQLVKDLSETQYRDFSRAMDEKTGIVGTLYGFKIMMRSSVLVYTNAATPVVKAYGAAGAATDNDAALFWHKDAVERAQGEIKVFDQANAPQYYGYLMSFLMRMGGRIRRADEKGVLAMVQAAA